MSDAPKQRILTVEEAAQWMRVGPKVIRRAINRGTLPAARLGREWRIDRLVLEEALRNGLDLGGNSLTAGETQVDPEDQEDS